MSPGYSNQLEYSWGISLAVLRSFVRPGLAGKRQNGPPPGVPRRLPSSVLVPNQNASLPPCTQPYQQLHQPPCFIVGNDYYGTLSLGLGKVNILWLSVAWLNSKRCILTFHRSQIDERQKIDKALLLIHFPELKTFVALIIKQSSTVLILKYGSKVDTNTLHPGFVEKYFSDEAVLFPKREPDKDYTGGESKKLTQRQEPVASKFLIVLKLKISTCWIVHYQLRPMGERNKGHYRVNMKHGVRWKSHDGQRYTGNSFSRCTTATNDAASVRLIAAMF